MFVNSATYPNQDMNLSMPENILSEVGFEPTPGEPDCDLNAAP